MCSLQGQPSIREQARVILDRFSREGSEHLTELVNESEFRDLKIYEPGLKSPFRKVLQRLSVTVRPISGTMSNLENSEEAFSVKI